MKSKTLEQAVIATPDGQSATYEISSGNVFADLGFEDAAELSFKTQLIFRIQRAIEARGLTQTEAAKLVGVDQPRLSKLLRGEFLSVSSDKLFDILNRLGHRIEIRVVEEKSLPENARTTLVA